MITWLASYPKSGNTWLRVLLTNYLRDAEAPASINHLDGGPIASARFWFDEWVGVEAASLSDEVVARLRPDVYRCMVREVPETLYMKVHDAWTRTDRGEPLFPAAVTAGVVYVLRNPLDLVASCANHWGAPMDVAVERLCDPALSLARSLAGTSDQLRQLLLDWSGHVRSWVDDSGLPVHLVRYEDLRTHPAEVFGEVVRFCGLPWDGARVRKAVAFSDFSELRSQEQAAGFREVLAPSTGPFFRRGQVGAWREELSVEWVQRLTAAHGDTMQRFGYLPKDSGSVDCRPPRPANPARRDRGQTCQ